MKTTLDGILNRRVMLEQPAKGYRVAVDTVFLAAAVPAVAGQRVLDLGCGVGGAMLALACRVDGITGIGIDIQPELIDLCRRNIARHECAAGLSAQGGDVTQLPEDFTGAFDHVMMNPPYHDAARHDVSDNIIKQTANSEKTGDLQIWIAAAARALKPGGLLTLIHRADRRDEITAALQAAGLGSVALLPLLPKAGAEAKRLIVRAYKDIEAANMQGGERGIPSPLWGGSGRGEAKPRLRLVQQEVLPDGNPPSLTLPTRGREPTVLAEIHFMRPLVLHKPDGGYTDEAEGVLRHAQTAVFQSP